MSDIGPGDLVVCVDVSPHGTRFDESLSRLRLRALYRVESLVFARRESLTLIGVRSSHPTGSYYIGRFRKIDAADERFTRTVRACRPCKELIG